MLFYRRPASIAQCPPGSAGWTRRVESEKGAKSLLVAPRHSPAPRSMPSDPSRAREEGDATYFERLEERERRRTCAIQVGTRRATPRPLLDRGRGCRAGATIRVNIPHPPSSPTPSLPAIHHRRRDPLGDVLRRRLRVLAGEREAKPRRRSRRRADGVSASGDRAPSRWRPIRATRSSASSPQGRPSRTSTPRVARGWRPSTTTSARVPFPSSPNSSRGRPTRGAPSSTRESDARATSK